MSEIKIENVVKIGCPECGQEFTVISDVERDGNKSPRERWETRLSCPTHGQFVYRYNRHFGHAQEGALGNNENGDRVWVIQWEGDDLEDEEENSDHYPRWQELYDDEDDGELYDDDDDDDHRYANPYGEDEWYEENESYAEQFDAETDILSEHTETEPGDVSDIDLEQTIRDADRYSNAGQDDPAHIDNTGDHPTLDNPNHADPLNPFSLS